MLILTDIDECVLGWADGFCHWLISKGFNIKHDWRDYDCVEKWLDHNNLNFDLIFMFNRCAEFENLNPIKKADVFIPLLNQMGHDFIALTACGSNKITKKYRENNLHKLFPNIFKSIICVDSGAEKEKWLETIPGDIWIEDNFRNAFYGTGLNYKTFIIDYFHNRHDDHTNICRIDDWEQVYNYVL